MAAETAFYRGEGGVVWQMDLPLSDNMREKVTKGYLTRVANEAGDPYVEPAAPDSGETPPPPGPPAVARPPQSASKAEWVGYAVRAHGVLPDDAEAMTKQDLIDRYGRDPGAVA